METTVRVLTLLQRLQERRFWTGEELAEELGVSARCVRRDVQRLRDLGYPVHASVGVGGGYALGAGADLPPLPLDEDEAIAAAVGLRLAASGSIGGLTEAALSALAKLEVVLPRALRQRLQVVEAASSSFDQTASIDAGVLMSLAAACRDSLQVQLMYRARTGEQTERRIHPVRLVHSQVRWYLVAWDLGREDWRTFRLDRVLSDSVTLGARLDQRAPPADDLVAYVREQLSHRAYAHQVRVRLRAPATTVHQRVGAYGSVVPDGPAHCWFETGGDDLDAVAPWLVSLGFPIERVEPAAMRQALARLGQRLLAASTH